MSQARCSSAVPRLRRRTSGHNAANTGCGRSQLRTQAFQASCSESSAKPGSSDQLTGSQRLLPRTSAGPAGASAAGVVAAGTAETSSAGGSGTLLHAASIPTIRAGKPLAARRHPRKTLSMLIILLEALLALVLLLLIVWWTMFSGRKKGELERDDQP